MKPPTAGKTQHRPRQRNRRTDRMGPAEIHRPKQVGKCVSRYGRKGSPARAKVIGQTAMLLPLGMPERLGKLVLGYFAARTLEAQPEYYRQIKNELQSGDYSAAQRNAIEDVLNIGMVTGGAMSFGGNRRPVNCRARRPRVPFCKDRPARSRRRPPARLQFGAIPGVPTRGIPAPPMPDPRLVRARPVVPGTPAEPRERPSKPFSAHKPKPSARFNNFSPKPACRGNKPASCETSACEFPNSTTPTTYAETIRGNQGQLRTPGKSPKAAKRLAAMTWNKQHPDNPNPWTHEKKRKVKYH